MEIAAENIRAIRQKLDEKRADFKHSPGKSLPGTGKALPSSGPSQQQAVARAVARVQQFLIDSRRSLVFQVDTTSGRTVISVINPETNELIRQIPPEEMVRIAARLESGRIRLFSASG